MNTTHDYTINAVQKALRILKLFEIEDELTLARISELSGIGKSSCLRFLYTLHQEGFIAYDDLGKSYHLGLSLFELGRRKYETMDFRALAIPHLRRLSDATGLICYLAVKRDDMLLMIDKVLPKTVPMWAQLMAQSGGTLPLYSTGIGRLFLARMTDEEVLRYLDATAITAFTPDTITDKAEILDLVRRARRDGTSYNHGENEPHVSAICAPIHNHSGAMLAGMSVAGMREVVWGAEHERYKNLLLEAVQTISRDLGYRERQPVA